MKKILGLLMLMVITLAGCSSASTDNTFTVGMECDYAPYNWTTTEAEKSEYAVLIEGSNNAYCDGYDVKVATEIANAMGKELVIKKISWDGLIPALNSGEIDAIIAGMSPTAERKQVISFSDAYYEDVPVQGIMVKSDSEYANASSLEDFEGAAIAAQLGTLQEDLLTQIPNGEETTSLDSYSALMQALQAGTIDGYVVENVVGEQQMQETPGLTFIPFEEGQGFVLTPEQTTTAIGVSKEDEELLAEINAALATISQEQRLEWMEEATSSSDNLTEAE
jgi:ABC-type amino acid transport substrate-binding protein